MPHFEKCVDLDQSTLSVHVLLLFCAFFLFSVSTEKCCVRFSRSKRRWQSCTRAHFCWFIFCHVSHVFSHPACTFQIAQCLCQCLQFIFRVFLFLFFSSLLSLRILKDNMPTTTTTILIIVNKLNLLKSKIVLVVHRVRRWHAHFIWNTQLLLNWRCSREILAGRLRRSECTAHKHTHTSHINKCFNFRIFLYFILFFVLFFCFFFLLFA